MKAKTQKLKLYRETLRVLEAEQLGWAGGVTTTTTTVSHPCTVSRAECNTTYGPGCQTTTTSTC